MTYVVLASDDPWFDRAIGAQEHVTVLRCGGATRAETVRNALQELVDVAGDDWIVVHDAVRPCVDAASMLRLQRELADDDTGGLLAIPMTSSLSAPVATCALSARSRAVDLWQAQTPQMFRYGVLRSAFARPGIEQMTRRERRWSRRSGGDRKLVVGNPNNLKITFPDDLGLAAAILATEAARVATSSCSRAPQVPRLRPRERLDAVRRQREADPRVLDARPRQPRAHAVAAVPVDRTRVDALEDVLRALLVGRSKRRR